MFFIAQEAFRWLVARETAIFVPPPTHVYQWECYNLKFYCDVGVYACKLHAGKKWMLKPVSASSYSAQLLKLYIE